MNVVEPIGQQGTAIILADRTPFSVGATRIEPALRSINGKEAVIVEPRVMQVLVALHDADGTVLSRERLIDLCWAGILVGDDAINRAIAELRRAAARAGADFEVETISKVGYRLKSTGSTDETAEGGQGGQVNRRILLGGMAVAAIAGAGAYLWSKQSAPENEYAMLIEQAERALRPELADSNRRAIALLEKASRLSPDDPKPLGLLAMALRNAAEFAPSDQVSGIIQRTDAVARQALALNPRDGNAMTALATIQPYLGDWIRSEQSLLEVLKVAPDTGAALNHLTTLYQSSGLLKRSKAINDQALRTDPLSPIFQFRDALKIWVAGNATEAGMKIDRVLQVWPKHPGVWNARLMLYAYTGQAAAGLTLLDNPDFGPKRSSPLVQQLWRKSLQAIDNPNPQNIEEAVATIRSAVRKMPDRAATGMMTLSTLGRVDEAFELARGYFLGQGDGTIINHNGAGQSLVLDVTWKRSMMLFTPATRAMRSDAAFDKLCEDMGLKAFWAQAGHQPDYRAFDQSAELPG